jgi:ATP-dependent Lhr-like helicase
VRRLGDMLKRIKGRIVVKELDRVSPLAVPIMLEISKQMVQGEAMDDLLDEVEAELIDDATRMI